MHGNPLTGRARSSGFPSFTNDSATITEYVSALAVHISWRARSRLHTHITRMHTYTHAPWIISIYRTCSPDRCFRKYRKRITSHTAQCVRGFINSGCTSFGSQIFQPPSDRLHAPLRASERPQKSTNTDITDSYNANCKYTLTVISRHRLAF